MNDATLLCTPSTRIIPDPVLPDPIPMGLGIWKHFGNMVIYNSTFNSQMDSKISSFFMNLLDYTMMCLAYTHISNIVFYWFTSRHFILLHSTFPLF